MACDQYDLGLEDAGKYIAVTLRVLLHHRGQSKSLLEQMGLRAERFYSTGLPYDPNNLMTTSALLAFHVDDKGGRFVAPLSRGLTPLRKVQFAEWWNAVVFADKMKRMITRRELVANVADTEGAHVDPTLEEAYMALSRENSMGWTSFDGTVSRPVDPPHMAAIRQIAHEVLITLREKRPQCFARPYTH